MARSGTDEQLLCVALAVVESGGCRGKEPIRIFDETGNPSVSKPIPNEPALAAAANQPAVEKAAQMVRDVRLTQPSMSDNFLHVAFA